MEYVYNVYGSEDSLDCDIAVDVSFDDTSFSQIEYWRKKMKYEISPQIDVEKELNINLVKIKDGIVVDCFLGIPDESNNAIFYTYNLHEQKYPLFVEKSVKRNIEEKKAYILRAILTFFTRCKYRKMIKDALKNEERRKEAFLHLLENINKIDEYLLNIHKYKKINLTDLAKKITFYCLQFHLLNNGIEVYTKNGIINNIDNLIFIKALRRTADSNEAVSSIKESIKIFSKYL